MTGFGYLGKSRRAALGLFVDTPEHTVYQGQHYIEECGQCDNFHPAGYCGDCRSDCNRYFDIQDYVERNGLPAESVEEVVWIR